MMTHDWLLTTKLYVPLQRADLIARPHLFACLDEGLQRRLTLAWFKIVALFNPLTYAAEGLRYAMLPPIQGHSLPTLDIGWVLPGLGGSCIVLFVAGIHTFNRRVIS